jgi:hypothetical protein
MNPYSGAPPIINRTPFILAAIGALAASGYWALLTLLILANVTTGGSLSPMQLILPGVLVVLYAVRGVQLFQGDVRAANRILWLHFVGGLFAAFYAATGHGLFAALQALKIAIHIFGGVTAYLAKRSAGV